MLPRQSRFASREDFVRMRKTGRSCAHPYFFFITADDARGGIRCAVSVSLKVSKKATIRNRIRRQLYAVLYHALPTFKKGSLILLVARPAILQHSFSELREAVRASAYRARRLI